MSNFKQSFANYYELTKPRVVMLMLVTSVIGMFLALPGMVPLDVLILGNVGIALCAGSAAAVNHLVDRQIDIKMTRTMNRPAATGRLTPLQVTMFALIMGVVGTLILVLFINTLTALLTIASLFGYAVVYTLWLKRATPQNIVIGGLAGAAPPLLGWTAVTNEIHGHGLLLVLIIFIWTPPHFWALAICRMEEYAKAEIPMLPVTHGIAYTKLNILIYTILMILVTVMPYIVGMFSWLYLISALVLGAVFLYWAIVLLKSDTVEAGMSTFKYSILYLALLFIAMLFDHYLLVSPLYQTY